MLEAVLAQYQSPEILWLVLTILIAGLVRGFSGFGTALIYVPVASLFMPPAQVIFALMIFDAPGQSPLLRDAFKNANMREVLKLTAGAAIGVPLGVWLLTQIDPYIFRWLVSIMVVFMIIAIATGWRYKGEVGKYMPVGIGTSSGFLGGFLGIGGPPIILFYLGGQNDARRIRANIILFFLFGGVFIALNFAYQGLMTWAGFITGLSLIPPYFIAILIGARLFKKFGDAHFRLVAIIIISLAALVGLPIFD